ncbi:hypothetical protein TDB9533_00924 [Thalassocella blandensis]|nr:hypothetical protein TDB9533_00924 [Thalassocella blandensis]
MAQKLLDQLTIEEQLIFYSLALTYPIYLVGGFYVLGSVLGWAVLGLYCLKLYLLGKKLSPINPLLRISPVIWLWVLGMMVMLVALIVAHIDRQMGLGQIIKSTFGWAKGWASMALFPLLGCIVNIRKEVIIRGCCIAAASAIPFAVLGLLLYIVGFSGYLYSSPLKVIGGPGSAFDVVLFGMNPETHAARWQFIGPWAPSAGLLSCIYLVICIHEKDIKWRALGCFGALVMCLFCQSRAGWVIFATIIPISIGLSSLRYPLVWIAGGILLPVLVLLGEPIYMWVFETYNQIKESRPGSTRVRGMLANLAVQRWENEAPIWGHAVVERGPKVVEYMPIGSHHSWYGLLFVKGIVGAIALAVPLFFTSIYMLLLAQKSKIAQTGLAICVILVGYSFFENLEILAYIYWPALIWIGFSLRPETNESSKKQNVNEEVYA